MTHLERAVMELLLAGPGPTLEALRRQLATARVRRREHTGVGFFIDFEVDASSRLSFSNLVLDGVEGTIPGLEHGAGFIVFVRDGVLCTLEGFSYAEPWPAEIGEFKLRRRTES